MAEWSSEAAKLRLFESRQRDRRVLYDAERSSWVTEGELRATVDERLRLLDAAEKKLAFLFCRTDLNTVAWYLACLESQHAVALLDNALSAEFRENLIDLYQPEFVISAEGVSKREITNASELHPDLKQLLSTSGSTGSPKFVRLTERNVVSNAQSIASALAIREEDCPIATLPLHYSYGLSVLNSHLLVGAPVVLTEQSIISAGFWETVRTLRCTSFAGVPYTYQMLKRLDIAKLDGGCIRVLTQAGGKMGESLISHFAEIMREREGRFFVMYGQTEATARIAILQPDRLSDKLGSVGNPIPGGSIEVIDGEIIYTGPNVMLGYATCRADLAKGDELNGRLHTADMGYVDEEGFLFLTGRTKRDAKLFGLRINLDEVEQLMHGHGPAAVIGKENKLVVFCEFGDSSSFDDLRRELGLRLNVAVAGLEFRRIEKLPTKASGKIDYDLLKAL